MNIPLPKLKAILLYFAENTDPRLLGKVKLMKLFYFMDFTHVKKYGTPITFDEYINMEHGPIPSVIKNLIDTADDDPDHSELADTIYFEYPEGTGMHKVHAVRNFSEKDKAYLSEAELDTLERVCARFGDENMKRIEEASHAEAPWSETHFLDKIPYTLASMIVIVRLVRMI